MILHRPLVASVILLCASILFSGCKKDTEEPSPDPGTTAPVTLAEADALLFSNTSLNNDGSTSYSAFAAFGVSGEPVDVGPVSLNSVDLDPTFTGIYFSPSSNTLDLSNATSWSVAGGNGYPAFVRDDASIPFPGVVAVSSGGTVDLSAGYTLSTTGVYGADSVEFSIGLVRRTVAGNSMSLYFTPADLESLDPTPYGRVMISAHKYVNYLVGGKRVFSQRTFSAKKNVELVD